MIEDINIVETEANKENKKNRWEPYTDNQGTCIGFTTKDYCIVAGDTRSSDGYVISSREVHKVIKLTDNIVLATGGMRADYNTLHKRMKYWVDMYYYNNRKVISLEACARMLSNMLYQKRFFPIYAFCILGGIDSTGSPALYTYDAIGSYQKTRIASVGSGGTLAEPILDSVILRHHRQHLDATTTTTSSSSDASASNNNTDDDWNPSPEKGVEYSHQVFTAVSERDIYTGDAVEIYLITTKGITRYIRPLKQD